MSAINTKLSRFMGQDGRSGGATTKPRIQDQ